MRGVRVVECTRYARWDVVGGIQEADLEQFRACSISMGAAPTAPQIVTSSSPGAHSDIFAAERGMWPTETFQDSPVSGGMRKTVRSAGRMCPRGAAQWGYARAAPVCARCG